MQIDHPILVKIHEVQEDGLTGFLLTEKDDKNVILCFQKGLISAACTSVSHIQFGKILVRRGALERAALPKLLQTAKSRRQLIGKTAVDRNLIEDMALKDAVHDQVVQAISHALSMNFEVRSFQEDDSLDLYLPAKINFERLVLELARNNLQPFRTDSDRLISLNNGRSLSHLPWYPQELLVLSQLHTPRTVQDLAIATGMDYARLNKILCVLDSLKLIAEADAPPSESTAVVRRDSFPFQYLTPEIGDAALHAKLETFHNPGSFVSEQFKNLKVRIAEIGAASQAPLKAMVVSSPLTEDGKSLISINLALSCAKDPGRKVIIIDCDLRNPSLQKFIGTSADPGLMGFLEDKYMEPHCYIRRLGNLFVMTAGGVADNPIELLSDPKMGELIAYLKKEFDTIILDCPPFGPIADAQIVTGLADGLLLVLRCGKTTYGALEKAVRNFDPNKLIGIIFNDVKPMIFNTQYNYRYYNYRNRSHYPYGIAKKLPRRTRNYLD